VESIPADARVLDACKPIYETLPGWDESTFGLTDFSELPKNAQRLLQRIEEVCECPVKMLSTGPDREHICRL
jgi:adenylosuccinate synthase